MTSIYWMGSSCLGAVNACSSFLFFVFSLFFFFLLMIHHGLLHEPVHTLDCMPNHKLTSIHGLMYADLPHQLRPFQPPGTVKTHPFAVAIT